MNDAIRHLDKRFKGLRPLLTIGRPAKGWLRAIRDALGMTTTQLAERLNVSQSRIPELEKAELSGQVTIQSLERAAQALGCRFVYAIVPETSLHDLVETQTRKAVAEALKELEPVKHTMVLENQAVGTLSSYRRKIMVEYLRDPKRLWRTK